MEVVKHSDELNLELMDTMVIGYGVLKQQPLRNTFAAFFARLRQCTIKPRSRGGEDMDLLDVILLALEIWEE